MPGLCLERNEAQHIADVLLRIYSVTQSRVHVSGHR